MRMNPLKEKRIVISPKVITTLFIGTALLVGFMGMSPSFTQSAMAQQGPPEDRPENPQCPEGTIGFERGQCELEPEITFVCATFDEGGPNAQTPTPVNRQCTVTGNPNQVSPGECSEVGGTRTVSGGGRGNPPTATCRYPADEVIDCPGDIVPTEEGQCFTRPGRGNDPTV
jgi:hypothetical protein